MSFLKRTSYKAQPQSKATPGQSGKKLDQSLLTSKRPTADLDQEQRIATAGETVPIVFGKRTSGIGGIWVQPSMIKSGTQEFIPSFLYVVSQGQIVSSPATHRTWAGDRPVKFIPGVNVLLEHEYATAATLEATPTVCPINGNSLFCGIETFSFLAPLPKAQEGAILQTLLPAIEYGGIRQITLGVGDTQNTVYYYKNADITVFRSDTGADVTATWNAVIGVGQVEFALNLGEFLGSGRFLGRAVGHITQGFFEEASLAKIVIPDLPDDAYLIFFAICDRVNTQNDPLSPASTGTLYGVQSENIWSPVIGPPLAWTFNQAQPNTPTADNSAYADITFLRVVGDITKRESDENGLSLKPPQLFVFYAQGVSVTLYSGGTFATGASNQLVDLVMYLFTSYKRADGAATADIASPIFTGNMTAIAAFCNEYSLHFNGIIEESVNLIEFASAVAPYFLLSFLSIGGQYRFEPILPLNSSNEIKLTALTPAVTFTESNILPGSFSKSYKPVEDRRPFIAVLLWRESNPSKVGIQRTSQVAFTSTSVDAPIEQFDLTDFCCDPNHAAIYGKYELAQRQHSTHTISLQTPLITTGLKPTDIIKIQRQRISSRGDNRTEIEWYQITGISYATDGISTIEAEHFPVDANDVAIISDDIINGSFRVLS